MVFFIFFGLLGLLHSSGIAATGYVPRPADPMIEPWRWTDYPFLKDKRIRCVVEDALGALWFGSDTGVWQYDGQTWVLFGGIGEVRDLCVGNDQRLYAGTNKGLWVLQGKRWINADTNGQGFPWDVSSLSTSKNGILWAGTPWGGLLLLEDGMRLVTTQDVKNMFTKQLTALAFDVLDDSVAFEEKVPLYGVLKTGAGQVYWVTPEALSAGVGLADRVVSEVSVAPDKFELHVKNEQESRSIQVPPHAQGSRVFTLPIYDILETKDNRVWMSLPTGLLTCFDLKKNRVVDLPDAYTQGNLSRLFEAKDGSVWVLSEDEAVGVQKFDGQMWHPVRLHSLADINLHTSIFQTHDGNIWVGGHQGTVNVLTDGRWQGYTPPALPLPKVRVAHMTQTLDGALWFVSLKQGVMRFDYQTERWASYNDLNFQCETPTHTKWFLGANREAIRQRNGEWTAWTGADGLISHPKRLMVTRTGVVWAVGVHNGNAATAQFLPDVSGGTWQTKVHEDLSWAIETKAVFEDSKGQLWFGAAVGHSMADGHLGGLLKYNPQTQVWHRFYRPDVPGFIYGIGESSDGRIWVGNTSGLFFFDGKHWLPIDEPSILRDKVDVIHTGPSGRLWVGLRAGDVFAYDGEKWQHFTTTNGLPPGRMRGILEEPDGRVWVGTPEGYSLYDGKAWDRVLHDNIPSPPREGILRGQNGIWINQHTGWNDRTRTEEPISSSLYTLFYQPDLQGPDTYFKMKIDKIQHLGHAVFEWTGTDAWQITPDAHLQFAWRLDGGPWSNFGPATHHTALELPDGAHTFEVVARDQDLNVDASPAILYFEVLPPIWRQAWFVVVLVLIGLGAVGAVMGLYARQKFLREFALEQQALQEISDAIQNMLTHKALHDVVSVIYDQLIALKVDFHTLTIHHVLDAEAGTCSSYEVGACKKVVQIEAINIRVVTMWQSGEVRYRSDTYRDAGGLDPQKLKNIEDRMGWPVRAILDVPHARGLLSLHSATPQNFSGKDIAFIKRVAEYLSLGVSRAEDILRMNDALDSARKLAHAVEHSPVSVVITDRGGNIEYVNPRFEHVTGYTMGEILGQNPRILKSGELSQETYQRMWETIKVGEVWRGEFHNKKKSGELFWEAASISGVKNTEGKITHYIAVKEDITQKKKMEKALLEAERNQVLVATAGAAAHEINQPLTVILGLTQLLMSTIQDKQLCEDLEYVEEAGQAIKRIVVQMAETERYQTKEYVGDAKIVDFAGHKQAD